MMALLTLMFPKLLYCILHVLVTVPGSSVYLQPFLPSLQALHSSPTPSPSLSVFSKLVLYSTLSSYILSYIHTWGGKEPLQNLLFVPTSAKTVFCNLFLGSLGFCFSARYPYTPQTFPNSSLKKWRWNHDHYNFHQGRRGGGGQLVTLLWQERFLLGLEVSPDLGQWALCRHEHFYRK